MDVSNFFTMQIPPGPKDTTVNTAGGNATSLQKTNFLDFILARLAEEKVTEESTAKSHTLLDSDNPAFDTDVDISEIIALNPEIREEMENWSLDPELKLAQTLGLNQKALEDALKSGGDTTTGITTDANVEAGPVSLMQALMLETQQGAAADGKPLLEKLQAILTKLQKLTDSTENGGLTLTNLTPEQITDLKAKVEVLLNENAEANISEDERKKAIDGIYLGLIKLVAPKENGNIAALQVVAAKQQDENNAKVNALAAPAPKDDGSAPPGNMEVPVEDSGDTPKFVNILKDFSGKKNSAGLEASVKTPNVKPDLSTLQGWPFTLAGSIFAPVQAPYDDYAVNGMSLQVTSLGTLANLVTQAHSASQPHPAMQVVAATVSKAAAEGESKTITIQMEPPELGRVEVRMNFGKDKSVKAVLVAEKQETHLMLQRDSHILERILADSGLNADGSSLSFELAQEGYDFNRNGGHDGSGRGSGADGADDIIKSTMTWHVDPDTGHMRYNILA